MTGESLKLLVGSMPGSIRDGEVPPPWEKNLYEKELGCVEDSLDEMLCIRERRTTNTIGEVTLDIKGYHYQRTSAMEHRYRELTPTVRITFDQCRALKMGVAMMI